MKQISLRLWLGHWKFKGGGGYCKGVTPLAGSAPHISPFFLQNTPNWCVSRGGLKNVYQIFIFSRRLTFYSISILNIVSTQMCNLFMYVFENQFHYNYFYYQLNVRFTTLSFLLQWRCSKTSVLYNVNLRQIVDSNALLQICREARINQINNSHLFALHIFRIWIEKQ